MTDQTKLRMNTCTNIDSRLILRYLRRQLTAEEKHRLADWLEENPENKKLLFGLKELYLARQQDVLHRKADTEAQWEDLAARLHGRSGKRTFTGRMRKNIRLAAAAAAWLVCVLLAGRYLLPPANGDTGRRFVVETGIGEQTTVGLPDGTTVRLNSLSKLSYSLSFGRGDRDVFLEGEALFDVASDAGRMPFSVHLKEYEVTVWGTRFNVSAYADDSVSVTTLEQGKIRISGLSLPGNRFVELSPRQAFIYRSSNKRHEIVGTDPAYASSWSRGGWMLKNTPLARVTVLLKRKFGYTFEIRDRELAEYPYTATIGDETLPEILKIIASITPGLCYRIDHASRTVIIDKRP